MSFTGDPDDLLNTTRSDEKGNFKVYGQDKEVTAIEPYLVIEHSCENGVINPVGFLGFFWKKKFLWNRLNGSK